MNYMKLYRHCVHALWLVIKNGILHFSFIIYNLSHSDANVVSKAAGCVPELVLLFNNLHNTDNNPIKISLQSAILSVLKVALTSGQYVR